MFVAVGIPYETFVLDGLNPNDEQNPTLIDHNNFHVYIERLNEKRRTNIYRMDAYTKFNFKL